MAGALNPVPHTTRVKMLQRWLSLGGFLAAALTACESHDLAFGDSGSNTQALADAEMLFCAHTSIFDECVGTPSTPAGAYASAQRRLAEECKDSGCKVQPIALYIASSANFREDPAAAHALLEQMRVAVEFARSQSAYSARATLAHMSELMRECQRIQTVNLASLQSLRDEAIDAFTERLQSISAQRDVVVTELAHDKFQLLSIRGGGERARPRLDAARSELVNLTSAFQAYKASEPTALTHLGVLSARASAASLEQIPRLQEEIVSFADAESRLPDELIVTAYRLRASLGFLQQDYEESLRPYEASLRKFGLITPDLAASASNALANLIAYAGERKLKLTSVASDLIGGLRDRSEALILIATDDMTKETVAKANLLAATAEFVAEATRNKQNLWQVAPKSSLLRLQFLLEKHDRFVAFLQLETLCDNIGTASWRETGCNSMRVDFSGAHEFLETSLPQQLRLNAMMMRLKGVPATLVQAIETELNNGHLRGAAAANDAALRSAERE